MPFIIFVLSLLLFPLAALALEPTVLLSVQAAQDSEPTAEPDSDFWKNAKGVSIKCSILGEPETNLHAEVRSRWTKNNLYLLFIGQYETLNLNMNPVTAAETPRLWLHDCFEAYVGGQLEQTNRYREFQMSPQGEFLDLDIDSTKPRPGHNGEDAWNSGMTVKARIDAARKVWIGEMRIPFASIRPGEPSEGDEVPANFCRQDGVGRARTFMAWQPTGAWTPHRPEKFGTLRLVKNR